MSAKKTAKTKTSTVSKKKRSRFPRIEAALASQPLPQAAAEPTAQSAPFDAAAEITTPEPGPAEPAPEATGVEGPARDAATTGEATAGDATPTEANPPEPATAEEAVAPAVVKAPITEALPEGTGESPLPQATTERPTAETTGAEVMAEGTAPEPAGTAPEAPDTAKKERPPRAPKTKSSDGLTKKLSALDAAARVLSEAGQPMGCKELIAAMATKGYWTSPGGKTPEATLYSALLREITTKGVQSRFVKAARGKFALRPTA